MSKTQFLRENYVSPMLRVKELQSEGVLASSTDYNEGWDLGDDE